MLMMMLPFEFTTGYCLQRCLQKALLVSYFGLGLLQLRLGWSCLQIGINFGA